MAVQVWRDLALVYASQQQPSDAQLCVQKMQQLEPHSAASYHAVGSVAAACKDTVGAKQAYKAALALDAMHAPALLSLGDLVLLPALAGVISQMCRCCAQRGQLFVAICTGEFSFYSM